MPAEVSWRLQEMYLLILAIIGFAAPQGIYFYWLATKFSSFDEILKNDLAVGFAVEMLAATLMIGYWFSVNNIGKVRTYWFVLLSLIGGLGFAMPLFYWLNKRSETEEEPEPLTVFELHDVKKRPAKRPEGRRLVAVKA